MKSYVKQLIEKVELEKAQVFLESLQLTEVLEVGGDRNDKLWSHAGNWEGSGKPHTIEHINGHFILHKKFKDRHSYHVTDDEGRIKAHLETKKVGKAEHVRIVAATNDNTFKLHKLYHHLITKHNKILVSDSTQTTGGKKIWHKLSQEKGVGVHGWLNGKAHNLGSHLSDETDDETHPKRLDKKFGEDNDHEALKNRKLLLVAHKK